MDGQLLGVIMGGLIGIAGGAISPWVQHTLTSKNRKAEAQRQSTLDIIEAIFLHNAYTEKLRQNFMFGKDYELPINPLARIEGLISVDFPHVRLELATFRHAHTSLIAWATNWGSRRIKGEAMNLDGWQEVIEYYTLATSNLIAAVTGQTQIKREQLATPATAEFATASSLASGQLPIEPA